MLKPLLMLPALAFLVVPALTQQATPPPAGQSAAAAPAPMPAEYVGKANPVKPTPEQQALAKKFYGWDCAMCHGETGNGKGDAADPAVPIHDFRDPASLAKLSDGEIFYIIQNGRGKMPADGDRLKPDLIWNMVVYLRQMSNTPPTPGGAH
ncbi:MAG: cytochrome c [Acidobacteriaceae bacterium]